MRRSTFVDHAVTYAAVGGTQAEDLMQYPPKGYHPSEQRMRLGSGRRRFDTASAALMTWGVQRGSDILISEIRTEERSSAVLEQGEPVAIEHGASEETVFGENGEPYIVTGMTAVLTALSWPRAVAMPIRVVYVIDEPDRSGFAYGTMTGSATSGEHSFVVEHYDDGSVWLVIRSFSRPSTRFRLALTPVHRLRHARLTRRHLRALLPAHS